MNDTPRFTARQIEKSNGFGKYTMEVFDGDTRIGSYETNFGGQPFYAFEQDGRWFALYSKHYTATRVMSLPDCSDLGGEEPHTYGFCPVEYYVPELTGRIHTSDDPEPLVSNNDLKWVHKVTHENGSQSLYWPDMASHPAFDVDKKAAYLLAKEESHAASKAWVARHPYITQHAKWGFIHGCYWGGIYTTRFVDLARAAEGILTVDDRFGELELPSGVALKDAIDTDNIDGINLPPEKTYLRIAVPTRFTLDGKVVR